MYFNIVQQLVFKTVTRLHRASFWGRALLVKMLINLEPHGIFCSNFVYYCILTLSSRNSDEASPSIILAGLAILVKMLITLEPCGSFCSKFLYFIYFNIVQPLVCKTVTRLHLASFGWPSSLNENGHNS